MSGSGVGFGKKMVVKLEDFSDKSISSPLKKRDNSSKALVPYPKNNYHHTCFYNN